MDEPTVRELSARVEDHRLDFKVGLYTQNEELAKDLMAIANLLARGRTGHILVGVGQRPDGTGQIAGIALGADRDHQYQQKVAGRLNRSPFFAFYPITLPEGEVGVFEITGIGERPYFPIVNAGNLRKSVPLKRLGSSTAEASPDEVREWVLEDTPSPDPAALIERIPDSEARQILIMAETLNQNFQVLRTGAFRAAVVVVDRLGQSIRFQLLQYEREVAIPLSAITNVWRDSPNWHVYVEGYLRVNPDGGIWEYHPGSGARG